MKLANKRRLFHDLAVLIEAGLPPAQAVKNLAVEAGQWQLVQADLRRGHTLSRALLCQKLISRFDAELLSISERAGRLAQALTKIAEQVESRTLRVNRIKAKLLLPFFVMVIAIIVGAILQLFSDPAPSFGSVFFSALVQLIFALLLMKILFGLLSKDAGSVLSMASSCRNFDWYRLLFQQTVFTAFLWQQASGIDVKTSFQRLSTIIDNKSLKSALLNIAASTGRGVSVAESIKQCHLPLRPEFLQALHTAEATGNFSLSLERQLQFDAIKLNLIIDNFIEWLPRVFYFFVVVFAISVILN